LPPRIQIDLVLEGFGYFPRLNQLGNTVSLIEKEEREKSGGAW
jgi:hypothetical protein